MISLQDWFDTPAFYAVLVLALLCLPLLFRHLRGRPKDEPRAKRRNFWHRR